jgi:iron complex transport system substrate-binding protein
MKIQLFNGLSLVAILALASWGATRVGTGPESAGTIVVAAPAAPGATELVDVRGQTVPAAAYQRIISLNLVADPILLHLVEPTRIIAVSEYGRHQHPDGFRFGDRPGVVDADDLETILSLKPDLVIASKFTEEAFRARLLESDIEVFDLGEMRGVKTTLLNIRTLGQLLQQVERAAQLEADYQMRLAALDAAIPDDQEAPGLYLSIYGDSLFGGTVGSSYSDMLRLAGVHDLAEAHGYVEWPRFNPEQLLAIDPPLVITQSGMGALLCGHSTLQRLACCQSGGRVIEVPGTYHSDPGLGLVHAAYTVQQMVHPTRGLAAAVPTPPPGDAPTPSPGATP